MTTPDASHDDTKLHEMLRIYAEHPLADGDVVLLLDDAVCLELEQVATAWDDVLRRKTAHVLRETASRVVVAVSRRGAELRPNDLQLWRDLHADLRGTETDLLPLRALPAA